MADRELERVLRELSAIAIADEGCDTQESSRREPEPEQLSLPPSRLDWANDEFVGSREPLSGQLGPVELFEELRAAADESAVERLLMLGACPLGTGIFTNLVGGKFQSSCRPTPEAASLLVAASQSFQDYVGLLGALGRLCICAALENDRLGMQSPLRAVEYDVMRQLVRHLPSPGARHVVVPNRRVPHWVLDQLVRLGQTAARAAASRGWIRVLRRSTHRDDFVPSPHGCAADFASLECNATLVTPHTATASSQYTSKDVPWVIVWEDRALSARSTVVVSGGGLANGVYHRVKRDGWPLQVVFNKAETAPIRSGYYGTSHPS